MRKENQGSPGLTNDNREELSLIPGWISRNKQRTILLLLLIIPSAIVLFYIFAFGRTVLFWDEWIMVPTIDHFLNGTIPWGDFFTQHNEYRMVFPKLAIFCIALATGFNTVAEMYFSWLVLLVVSLLLLTLCFRYFGRSSSTVILFIPVVWLLWSLRQWENFLFGFQVNYLLCLLGFVTALVLLDRSQDPDLPFLGALGGGIITSFSLLNGLLIWPIGVIQILLQKKGKKMLLPWIVVAVSTGFLYFFDWKRSEKLPSISFFTNDPTTSIQYFLGFLGSPLSPGPWGDITIFYSILVGILVLVSAIAGVILTIKYDLVRENSPWICLLLFSLGTALLTTIGRSGFGIVQAMSSRYVTFTIPGIIGLYFLYVTLYRHRGLVVPSTRWIVKGITCLILFGVFLGMLEGVAMGMKIASDRDKLTCTLINYRSASDDDLSALYPNPGLVRESARVLERRHLNVFSDPGVLPGNRNCSTIGTYPDLYNQLFGYKEKMNLLISWQKTV